MTLDAPSVLLRLIEAGERVLAARPLLGDALALFNEAAAAAAETGAVLGGATAEARMLVTAVRNAEINTGDRARAWQMIVGALVPMVRSGLARALEERAAGVHADPEAQYRGPRR